MPWRNSPEDRAASAAFYSDPQYQANRKAALQRAGGRCEQCGRRRGRLHVDHIVPRAQGGGHDLANLQVLCSGPGSCHAAKTAAEGNASAKRKRHDPPAEPRTRW
jgi:5-methylcytosine-specific restriction enzyme A